MRFCRVLSAALCLSVFCTHSLRAGDSPQDLERQGVQLDNQGKGAEALQKLRQAAALDGNDSTIQLALGMITMKQGNYTEAQSALERAAQLDPNSPPVHYHLAMLYEKSKDLPRARAEWEKVLQLSPSQSVKEIAERHLGRLGAP